MFAKRSWIMNALTHHFNSRHGYSIAFRLLVWCCGGISCAYGGQRPCIIAILDAIFEYDSEFSVDHIARLYVAYILWA